jgi:HPt (histidine-containing phosphotransfer) domain-containing protein
MIDRQKFNDTLQYFDKDVILDIIDLYEKELPARFEKLQKNIFDKDFDALAFNVHSLKSVTGAFMAAAPLELAKIMEERALSRTDQDLPELFKKLKYSTEELLMELRIIRQELLSGDHPLFNKV